MNQILQHCVDLQSLNCCCCPAITDHTIYRLSNSCQKLEKLNIGYNSNISPESIFHFLSVKNNGFKLLLCVSCIRITDEDIVNLNNQFPDVDINSPTFL
mmetsp:Transcript_3846/g.5291  ORF Transcript_3846/g.5291 Transcript_3846/m.5291 type:complete len:99 (+) Transcript_3846:867-1163(+)